MKKRIIALLLLAALAVAFTACTNEPKPENNTTMGEFAVTQASENEEAPQASENEEATQAPETPNDGLGNGGANTEQGWGELHPVS